MHTNHQRGILNFALFYGQFTEKEVINSDIPTGNVQIRSQSWSMWTFAGLILQSVRDFVEILFNQMK